ELHFSSCRVQLATEERYSVPPCGLAMKWDSSRSRSGAPSSTSRVRTEEPSTAPPWHAQEEIGGATEERYPVPPCGLATKRWVPQDQEEGSQSRSRFARRSRVRLLRGTPKKRTPKKRAWRCHGGRVLRSSVRAGNEDVGASR